MRITRGVASNLLSGFMFRPFMFFIIPGLTLMLPTFYMLWLIIKYTMKSMLIMTDPVGPLNYRIGAAVANAFEVAPHTFIVGGISLLVAIQLISLGILSLQNKRYFEEMFHLGSNINKNFRENIVSNKEMR